MSGLTLEIDGNKKDGTVADTAYAVIKNNILNWNLKPGKRISEKEMAEALDVSRTPVRESFIRLQKEQLLDILPQRGTFISRIDLREVEEGLFIRRSLELSVLKLAVKEFSIVNLGTMTELLKKQKDSIQSKDYVQFLKLDELFHKNLFLGCGKVRSWNIMQEANTQYNRVRMLTLIDIDKYESLLQDHETILRAIHENDIVLAEQTINNHLEQLYREEEVLKAKYPDYFV